MAKLNADWFSHDTDASQDEKVIYLESLFGDSGYAWFFKMLETLARSDGFEIEWSELKCAVLARKFNTTQQEFNNFIVAATKPEIKAFVIENDKIYSPGLKMRLERLNERRRREAERLAKKRELTTVAPTNNDVATTNAHSIVKDSKEENSKEEGEEKKTTRAEIEKLLSTPNPVSLSRLDTWINDLTDDYRIKEGFTITQKIPAGMFEDYRVRFTALARTAPDKYNRQSDLTGHFLNWSRIEYEKRGKPAEGPKSGPAQRATIQHLRNDRPELKEKQAF